MRQEVFRKTIISIVLVLLALTVIVGAKELSAYSDKGVDNDACFMIPDTGSCTDGQEKYYFDFNSNECKAFMWGGCEGKVPFEDLETCQRLCVIPEPN